MDGRGSYFLHAVCPHCLRLTAYPGAYVPMGCEPWSVVGAANRPVVPAPPHGPSSSRGRCAVPPISSQPDQRWEARDRPAEPLEALVWQARCDRGAHPAGIASTRARAHGGPWLPQELHARRDALPKAYVNLATQRDRLTEASVQDVIPRAAYHRRRHALAQQQQAFKTPQTPRAAPAECQGERAGMVPALGAFCPRSRPGVATATFEQKRPVVERLLDRVLGANGAGAMR
jgi:site-specific DNA recombinase